MRPARILILRGGALGDFLVTLPALAALRSRWPDGHLELIGYPHLAPLTDGLVTKTRSINDGALARYFAPDALIRDEDQEYFASFDVIINYLHDPEAILANNLKRCGVEVLISASPLVTERHATEHFLAPLESLAIYDASHVPDLRHLGLAWKPTDNVAIHPGSGSRRKNWPVERFVELARDIQSTHGLKPVFFTGDAEREYIPELERHLEGFERRHNLPLVELAESLASARLYIGNDSGVTHLAAATGCPTLALFGPSDPALWSPRGTNVEVLSAGQDMTALTTSTVLAQASQHLNAAP